MREIIVWLSADAGNDIYETITVPNDFTEEQVEKVAKQAIFNNIDWGWYEKECENEKKRRSYSVFRNATR